jgi:hypothetical protein
MNGQMSLINSSQKKNKYMKNCSISLAIREMHIKTTLRFHLVTVRMAIIKKINKNKAS